MSNTVHANTIINGSRNLVLHFSMIADGSGNFTNYPLIDITDYTNEGENTPNSYSVMKVAGRNNVGTTLALKFGSSVDDHVTFFQTFQEGEFSQQWPSIVPKNPDQNMQVIISTLGFDASGDTIDLTIWLKKRIKNPIS